MHLKLKGRKCKEHLKLRDRNVHVKFKERKVQRTSLVKGQESAKNNLS